MRGKHFVVFPTAMEIEVAWEANNVRMITEMFTRRTLWNSSS